MTTSIIQLSHCHQLLLFINVCLWFWFYLSNTLLWPTSRNPTNTNFWTLFGGLTKRSYDSRTPLPRNTEVDVVSIVVRGRLSLCSLKVNSGTLISVLGKDFVNRPLVTVGLKVVRYIGNWPVHGYHLSSPTSLSFGLILYSTLQYRELFKRRDIRVVFPVRLTSRH